MLLILFFTREVLCGAAPLGVELGNEVIKRLGLKMLRQGYGMTELGYVVFSRFTFTGQRPHSRHPGQHEAMATDRVFGVFYKKPIGSFGRYHMTSIFFIVSKNKQQNLVAGRAWRLASNSAVHT